MGWFKVDHVSARVRRLGTLSVALIKRGGKEDTGVALRMRLSRDVQEVTGLTAGDTVDLQWGEEELAGRILLTRAEGDAGQSQLRWQHPDKRAAVETRFGGMPDGHFPGVGGRPTFLKQEPRPAISCPWSVTTAEDGAPALEVTLPKGWFSAPPDGSRPVSRLGQPAQPLKRHVDSSAKTEASPPEPGKPTSAETLTIERAEVEEAAAAVGAQTWHAPRAEAPPKPTAAAAIAARPLTPSPSLSAAQAAHERAILEKVIGLLEIGTERKSIHARVPGLKGEVIDRAEQELERRRRQAAAARAANGEARAS